MRMESFSAWSDIVYILVPGAGPCPSWLSATVAHDDERMLLQQSYYQATAREVRRLSSTVRSPVYSTFSEALTGAVTIRALGAEHMTRLNEQQVAVLQRANFTGVRARLLPGIPIEPCM